MPRYSIFELRGNEWIRMTSKSYHKTTAQMVWFDEILESLTKPNIKPKKLKKVRF